MVEVEAQAEGIVEAEAEGRGGERFAPVEGGAGEGGGNSREGEEGAVGGDEVGVPVAGDGGCGHWEGAWRGWRGFAAGVALQIWLAGICAGWSTLGTVCG